MRIPIIYASRPGYERQKDAYRSPVIEIGLGYDPHANLNDNKPFAKNTLRSVRALIDTGADDFCVDIKLLKLVGAPLIQGPSGSLKTVHGLTEVNAFTVHLAIPKTPSKAEVNVLGVDINDGTRAYHAIFGLRFLESGVLVLNPRGDSHFTFHDDPSA